VTLHNGKDTITGGSGADSITAGAGADSISGGAGNDTLVGGLGADIMSGGTGSDTFTVAAGDSNITARDSITDFAMTLTGNGRDTLDLPTTTIKGAATVGGADATDDITVGGVTIASAIIAATGLTTFFSNDAATTAVTISSANALNAALQFLEQPTIVADGDTVFFAASSSLGAAGTSTGFVVFQGAAGGDIAIDLVGLTGATTLGTVGADTTILLA
jgi:Ca2+-binding RTX toxin-like protein